MSMQPSFLYAWGSYQSRSTSTASTEVLHDSYHFLSILAFEYVRDHFVIVLLSHGESRFATNKFNLFLGGIHRSHFLKMSMSE